MYPLKTLRNILPPLILISTLFAIYLRTLAPGLTWANDGSDGGDLIATAATGGIAHPTGYPLYLLLARLFQFLPLGSLAFRTNLMSAILAVLAAWLIFQLVTRAQLLRNQQPAWPSGLAAAFAFGLAPLVWSQAVITEVYTLQAVLTALILWLYTGPIPAAAAGQKRLDCWRGLVLGLALCNQIITILVVPLVLMLGSFHHESETDRIPESLCTWFGHLRFDVTSLIRQLVFVGLGLSLYLLIPLRAFAGPPINWGNAITPVRLWWLISGQLYQGYYLQFSFAGIGERIQDVARLLLEQFGLPGLVLGLSGLMIFGARTRLYFLTGWVAAVSLVFAIFYRSNDSYVYLIPAFLSFAIWIGLGVSGIARQLSGRPILGLVLGAIVIGYFGCRTVTYWSNVDASHDQRAESFGTEVLTAAPKNAILFAKGDQAVFALWYFHFALGERPDLTIVAEDLLHFDWYQENLRLIYPSLVIPGPFPWPETIVIANGSRAVCYVQYADQAEIDCLKPLASP